MAPKNSGSGAFSFRVFIEVAVKSNFKTTMTMIKKLKKCGYCFRLGRLGARLLTCIRYKCENSKLFNFKGKHEKNFSIIQSALIPHVFTVHFCQPHISVPGALYRQIICLHRLQIYCTCYVFLFIIVLSCWP